jgi:DNA-binding NarL/FixJ family response regulator
VSLRCVIVDDSPRFLEAARGLLDGPSMSVVAVASTGAEAMRRVAEVRPDVVLVDLALGAESGFEVARRLRGGAGARAPRVILMSTHTAEDYADLIAASPAVGFLSKSDLSADAVRGLLDGGEAGRVSGPRGT